MGRRLSRDSFSAVHFLYIFLRVGDLLCLFCWEFSCFQKPKSFFSKAASASLIENRWILSLKESWDSLPTYLLRLLLLCSYLNLSLSIPRTNFSKFWNFKGNSRMVEQNYKSTSTEHHCSGSLLMLSINYNANQRSVLPSNLLLEPRPKMFERPEELIRQTFWDFIQFNMKTGYFNCCMRAGGPNPRTNTLLRRKNFFGEILDEFLREYGINGSFLNAKLINNCQISLYLIFALRSSIINFAAALNTLVIQN